MKDDRLATLTDHPLNYRQDQRGNLNPQLRQLNLKLGAQTAVDFLLNPPAALLVGGTLGLLLKRKFALAALFVGGFVLQQRMARLGATEAKRKREAREIEFERRTLKAQRGDYGKLDVIAFK